MGDDRTDDDGFSLIELMMAGVVMAVVMLSLTYVLTNALVDTGYARQRATAINLANQTLEEVRALPWSTLQNGLYATAEGSYSADPTYSTDKNIDQYGCFDGLPLDVNGANASAYDGSCSSPTPSWQNPSCLSSSGLSAPPLASSLSSPAPLDPHQVCYAVGGTDYGIDVYITWVAGSTVPPVTATVVVSWNNGLRSGVDERVVTTTEITNCTIGEPCSAS